MDLFDLLKNHSQPLTPVLAITKWSYPTVVAFVLVWILASIMFSIGFHRHKKGIEWDHPQSRLWHPIGGSLSPYILILTRGLSILYVIGIQLGYIVWSDQKKHLFDYFKYTSWNWGLLALYFALALLLSLREVIANKEDGFFMQEVLSQEMGILGHTVMLIFEVIWPSVFVVCITYWCILIPGAFAFGFPTQQDFFSVAHHTSNFLVVLVEFLLNDIPIHLSHIWIFLLWPGIFCLFTLAFYGYRELWPYPIMDARVASALGWYGALWIGNAVMYVICYGAYRLKRRCLRLPPDENDYERLGSSSLSVNAPLVPDHIVLQS